MFAALKRLNIYQKEMYPIISRLLLGYLVFGEIYFIILLNHGIIDVKFGIQELVCGFTVFSFLFWLRIADDFKDYELDCRLFKERPLPSGRVTKKDLGIFITILIAITLVLNFIYMNNFLFCVFPAFVIFTHFFVRKLLIFMHVCRKMSCDKYND